MKSTRASKLGYSFFKILIILVVAIIFGATSLYSTPLAADTSKVIVRMPPPDFKENYLDKKEFVYSSPPQNIFPLRQFILKIENQIRRWINYVEDSPILFQIFLFILVLLIVLFVIRKTKIYSIIYTNNALTAPNFTIAGIQLEEIDFDLKIKIFLENQEYRQAVRFLFLKLIERLKEKGHIQYSKEKTNFDYLNNLKSSKIKSQFLMAVNIYNHVWYGDMEIGKVQYTGFEQRFQTIYNLLDAEK